MIKAKNLEHLKELIMQEIELHGNNCDLNHIDITKVTDINYLFNKMRSFNGNVSKWDTSNVKNMSGCFYNCDFNGDISQWDVSKVQTMAYMFYCSKFNGDISKWDVENVDQMYFMFSGAQFKKDLNDWKPLNCQRMNKMFDSLMPAIPYWATYDDNELRKQAINSYWLEKKLESNLEKNDKKLVKKVKL